MRTDDTHATLPELSDEVGERPGQPVSSLSASDGGSPEHAADRSRRIQTISLTFSRCQCADLAGGVVSDEMREYFTDAVTMLDESPAEAMARTKRRRKVAA